MAKTPRQKLEEVLAEFDNDRIIGLAVHFLKMGYVNRTKVEYLRKFITGEIKYITKSNGMKRKNLWKLDPEIADRVIEEMRNQFAIMKNNAKKARAEISKRLTS